MHLAAENDGERAAGERSLAVLLGSCANQVLGGKVGDQGDIKEFFWFKISESNEMNTNIYTCGENFVLIHFLK